jgi:hypothetical protein
MSADRRKLAVRKLKTTIRIIFRIDEFGLSGMQHGRLAVELRRDLARLERLLRNDPENIFWEVLQMAILKTVKYLSRR